MTTQRQRRDLVALVADKSMEATLRGLLLRPEALGTRAVSYEIYSHPAFDAGCRAKGPTFLRSFCNQFAHALILFDREGSGREAKDASDLESEIEKELARNGWEDRAAAIVLDPELEIWVWSYSPEVDRVLGWSGCVPALRQWLVEEAFLSSPSGKPARPKEALLRALRHVGKQPSASLFRQLSERVSFRRCTDRAFRKLRGQLVNWFPTPKS